MTQKVQKGLQITALILAALVVIAIFFHSKLSHSFSPGHAAGSNSAQQNGRKVLYWFDAMNPQHTYNAPGKAPDGMDLVPKYADEQTGNAGDASSSDKRKILYWYDPMHPNYRSDKPGIAPDCGMQLVPQYQEDNATQAPAGTVTISSEKQQLIGIRTGTVQKISFTRDIRTTAQVLADESRISHIHVKVSGYVDKVYVDFIGQQIKKGQPLFTLYSPDLVATQEEYLIAKRGNQTLGAAPYHEVAEGAQSLLHSAKERLKLWDISDEQINRLDRTGQVEKTITFYSPANGFVTDRKAFPQTAINPDMELYTISDLSAVWITADVYEYEIPYVRLGQQVELTLPSYPGKTFAARISYIYPTVDPQTRTVKIRCTVANPKLELKPQMLAEASIRVNYGVKLAVPSEAILNSGLQQTVFVAISNGKFEPRKVTVGPIMDGKAVILSGLKEGETIVTSGNFLIDSESQMKNAMGGMQH